MRAERLLRIVALLQRRGRMTAGELARELEVSARTIQRDMEALSGAGIPVYATRGADGGWALLRGYRTSITGLTAAEALAIVVGRPQRLLADLGLQDHGEGAADKVMAAVSASARDRAEHARERIYVDFAPWGSVGERDSVLPLLFQAVWDGRLLLLRYATSRSSFVVAPLGLVAKGGSWYLVGRGGFGGGAADPRTTNDPSRQRRTPRSDREDRFRTYRVSRMHDVTVTDGRFERPQGWDLVRYWHESSSRYAESYPSFVVRLRLRGDALIRAGWTSAREKRISEPDAGGWAEVVMDCETGDEALGAIRNLGPQTLVLEPASMRRAAMEAAKEFVRMNEGISDA